MKIGKYFKTQWGKAGLLLLAIIIFAAVVGVKDYTNGDPLTLWITGGLVVIYVWVTIIDFILKRNGR
jgi:hypothetical protein